MAVVEVPPPDSTPGLALLWRSGAGGLSMAEDRLRALPDRSLRPALDGSDCRLRHGAGHHQRCPGRDRLAGFLPGPARQRPRLLAHRARCHRVAGADAEPLRSDHGSRRASTHAPLLGSTRHHPPHLPWDRYRRLAGELRVDPLRELRPLRTLGGARGACQRAADLSCPPGRVAGPSKVAPRAGQRSNRTCCETSDPIDEHRTGLGVRIRTRPPPSRVDFPDTVGVAGWLGPKPLSLLSRKSARDPAREALMAIMGYDPFRQLLQLQDRVFRAFDQPYGLGRGTVEPEVSVTGGTWTPPVDVFEDAEGITLKVELPEVDPKDVDIQIEGNALTLRGDRRLEKADKGQTRAAPPGGAPVSFFLPNPALAQRQTGGTCPPPSPLKKDSRPGIPPRPPATKAASEGLH